MKDKCTILCADSLCIHNRGSGYYGVCNNPDFNKTVYSGIDRMYMNTCKRRKSQPVVKDDGDKDESGLLEVE